MNNLTAEQRATCAGHSPEIKGGGGIICHVYPAGPAASVAPRGRNATPPRLRACKQNRASPRSDVNQGGASRRGEG